MGKQLCKYAENPTVMRGSKKGNLAKGKPMNYRIVVAGSCLLCGNLIDDNSGIFFCRQCRDKLANEEVTEKEEEWKTDD